MPIQKPAGLDEAVKPFKAMIKAWGLQDGNIGTQAIADSSPLRAALPLPIPTVGDVRTLVRILESVYGEFPL